MSGVAENQDERAAELFAAMPDPRAREELVRMFRPLAEYLARRFTNRGESPDDLVQVASIGLLKAIDRFDLARGVKFPTYAVPTIVGELKRYFRDAGWALRVPRSLQERWLLLRGVVADLSQELGRSPTVAELSERSGLSEEDVLEATEAAHAHSIESLDAPPDEQNPAAMMGDDDANLEMIEGWAPVAPLLRALPERERRLLYLRFVEGLSQSEIASRMGISQMHVSRLLSRTLAHLREAAGATSV